MRGRVQISCILRERGERDMPPLPKCPQCQWDPHMCCVRNARSLCHYQGQTQFGYVFLIQQVVGWMRTLHDCLWKTMVRRQYLLISKWWISIPKGVKHCFCFVFVRYCKTKPASASFVVANCCKLQWNPEPQLDVDIRSSLSRAAVAKAYDSGPRFGWKGSGACSVRVVFARCCLKD